MNFCPETKITTATNAEMQNGSEKKKDKIIEELCFLAANNDNFLIFKDLGDGELKSGKDGKINEKILKKPDEKNIKTLREYLEVFESFLKGPIFVDSFHEDHFSRDKWEKSNLQKISPEAQKYYKTNRLYVNKFSGVIEYLDVLLKRIEFVPDIKDKLFLLKEQIPKQLKEMTEIEGYKLLKYNKLPDDEKITAVEKLTKITKELVSLLEEKN